MKFKALLVAALLAGLFRQLPAAPLEDETLLARADARAEEISDVKAFLREIKLTLAMARRGEYGSLNTGDVSRMREAQSVMATLLHGHDRATELDADGRIAVYNAQELITSILRSDEKNRKICKRSPVIGSRLLSKVECLTVREREFRAREAAEVVLNLQSLNH